MQLLGVIGSWTNFLQIFFSFFWLFCCCLCVCGFGFCRFLWLLFGFFVGFFFISLFSGDFFVCFCYNFLFGLVFLYFCLRKMQEGFVCFFFFLGAWTGHFFTQRICFHQTLFSVLLENCLYLQALKTVLQLRDYT